jgi:hypothetical protein
MKADDPAPASLNAAELRRLAEREKDRQDKQAQRARTATEKAVAALAPNASGYVVPPMPDSLTAIRRWVRRAHDAYSRREIGPFELTEIRRSATSIGDLYRAGADLRKAEAAIRAAQAQERMAEVLAAVEHGGTALLMLSRLQDGLSTGKHRPIPGSARALAMQASRGDAS